MKIATCRICGCAELTVVLDLGTLAPCSVFPRTVAEDPAPRPLCVVQCGDCGLVQLLHDAPLEESFNPGYGYRSSIQIAMRRHLADLATRLGEMARLTSGDLVIDIGANDGYFLNRLSASLRRVAVDPLADKFADQYADTGVYAYDEFWSDEMATRLLVEHGEAKAITAIACLYDLPDPNAFMAAVKKALAPDGVFMCEVGFLPIMLATGAFDSICHEHIEYYHGASLDVLMQRHGFVIDYEEANTVNGGSVLFTARPVDYPTLPAKGWTPSESTWDSFRASIVTARRDTISFFAQAHLDGKVVHGLGASTKGNTLLQHFKLGRHNLPCISDANPDKWGRFTPGTLIPIVSEAESRAQRPDYYFVLPWHFRDTIIEREREFLERGGKLVFPLPKFEIVGA